MNKTKLYPFLGILVLNLLAGAGITALGNGGFAIWNWLITSLLLFAIIQALIILIKWAGDARSMRLITLLAFAIRLIVGIGLAQALPVIGYDNEQHQAGYLFYDAFERDSQAWHLAESGEPLSSAFQNQYISDQYGGLLALSALVYRTLSPDAHRPILMIILAAFAGAIGIPFLWKALRNRWNNKAADWSAIILAFYPEAILLGSSHMREPYLIALISIAIYAMINWHVSRKKAILILTACFLGLLAFSWRVAVVIVGVLAIWFWLDILIHKWGRGQRLVGWMVVAAGVLVMAALSWAWFRETANYDAYLTEQASGSIQALVERIGEKFKIPLVTVYGLTQPVLPAALVALSNPLASAISILRSLGWYLLAPMLLYGSIASLKAADDRDKRLLIWIAGISLVWVVASSMRAGGDMWDNPRYRSIFLPFFAMLIGWALQERTSKRDPWLARMYIIEAMAVLIFLNWYLVRYYGIGFRVNVFNTGFLSIAVMILAPILFWLVDRRKMNHP